MPSLVAVGLDVAEPVVPELPDPPEVATGFEVELDVAAPVLPDFRAKVADFFPKP